MSERAGADEAVARRGVSAVFMTLGEAVPDAEFQDVMSQLPNEFHRKFRHGPPMDSVDRFRAVG
ncbi:hypothetical protein AAW14_23150 [Streptomyces hygroscopicus]|uniref:DUF2267 domain-containing protein n=1 Tax=Streptomyces hygroscopicus TaxID=1912 RepID=UPI00223FE07A|nr:DUF2267 domain-containing protein [Streptomyces hygroscopicus]MCW7944828.1 hypothetical protein [Streptomyces hygroscopicus]